MAKTVTIPALAQLSLETTQTALVDSVMAAIPSPNSRRAYLRAIEDLVRFSAGRPITRMLLLKWRASMASLSSSTVNVRLSGIRKLIHEANKMGLLSGEQLNDLLRVQGLTRRGSRTGNWLTATECKALLAVPDRKTLRGKRNYCVLALLLGCALRRDELSSLQLDTIQRREGRWVLADLLGKGGRVRTVAIPGWVKQAIDAWTKAGKIESGKVIRPISLNPRGLSSKGIWEIVRNTAEQLGISNVGPHDLRRTCAKLCRSRGGELEQIQFMLGHASIQTTERYLGSTQDLAIAVNDDLGI